MRLISLDTLKSGARIQTAIRKANGQTLLPAGALLTERYISRLKGFGFTSVYVDDDLFDCIEAIPTLSDATKMYALNAVESFFTSFKKGKLLNVTEAKEVGKRVYEDIRSICHQPISLFNMYVVDDLSFLHSVNVATMAAALAIANDMKSDIAQDIVTGALLHDIVVENLKEKEDIEHPTKAMEYLKKNHGLNTISYISVAMHHENYNGTGYPKKLDKDAIYIGAKIISVCDTYDNLVYGLAGHQRMSEYQAIEYINGHVGTIFDPNIVSLFNKTIAIYPLGATVILNNGHTAIVTKQNSSMPTRPVVRLLMNKWEDCLEFDLMSCNTMFINKVEL